MAYSSLSIANKFILLAQRDGKTLSNMQLQKLVFFSHGYVLAFLDKPLTFDPVKAWTFGPVYPALYNTLRTYGSNGVPQPLNGIPEITQNSAEEQIIESVWNAYKHHSAYDLSGISHNIGSPWYQIWTNNKFQDIPDNITKDYYKRLI